MHRLTGFAVVAAAMISLVLAPAAQAGSTESSQAKTPPALAKKINKPVSSTLMATLKKASDAGLQFKQTPQQAHLNVVSGLHLNTGDKVGLLYVGADFCPYCAGQRWAVVLTLLRFGEFHDLRYMLSSPKDVYPNTPTVTFQYAQYKSDHVALQAVEVADRHRQSLMKLNPLQKRIYARYDAPPYTRYTGSIPFIYLGGWYTLNWPMLLPKQIKGENWQQIAADLANQKSELFQSVMPRVNLMTAAICRLDGAKPSDVCTSPGVVAAKKTLLTLHPPKQ